MKKLAVLQMADTPQIESSAMMLRYAGYDVKVCGRALRNELQAAGCDTVLAVSSMIDMGYDPLDPTIQDATLQDMKNCDLFCEIKVRNVPKIWKRWPRLEGKTIWWRVNGARPEHVIRRDANGNVTEDCGDEEHPPCPVVTANLWYGIDLYNSHKRNYTFWPPYPRMADYNPLRREAGWNGLMQFQTPFCLCHGLYGWGFKSIVDPMQSLNVRLYGSGAPKGIISHDKVPELIANALCMVHVKSSDCPGWALYESILGGCPVVVARWLVHRMLGFDLFVENETCYMYGSIPDEYGRGPMDWDLCMEETEIALGCLKNMDVNKRIAIAARERLIELMWQPERDGPGWIEYLQRVLQ